MTLITLIKGKGERLEFLMSFFGLLFFISIFLGLYIISTRNFVFHSKCFDFEIILFNKDGVKVVGPGYIYSLPRLPPSNRISACIANL